MSEAPPVAPPSGRKLGRYLAVAGVMLLIGLLAYGLAAKSPRTGIDERLARAESAPAPGFDLALLARGTPGPKLAGVVDRVTRDGRISARELRGTPYVLNFWASWCIPCRVEAPRLEQAWAKARRAGILFVGLNQQDLVSDARAFMREYRQSYLNIRDPQNDVALRWGVTGIPETFFVTARGRVVGHVIGAIAAEQLRAGLEAVRSGRVRPATEGGARESAR